MDELRALRTQLAALTRSDIADPDERRSLESTINRRQAELGRLVPDFRRASTQVSTEQLINALGQDTAFVDYLTYQPLDLDDTDNEIPAEQLLAIVVSAADDASNNSTDITDRLHLIPLGPLEPIAQHITRYRRALGTNAPLTERDRDTAQALYAALWEPLVPFLRVDEDEPATVNTDANTDTPLSVYLAPDGVLNLLPFASLIDNEGRYLIERHPLLMLSSGRDLVIPPTSASTQPPVVLAAPLYEPDQIQAYPPSVDQVQHIAEDEVIDTVDTTTTLAALRDTASSDDSTTIARSSSGLHFNPLVGALHEGRTLGQQLEAHGLTPDYLELGDATEATLATIRSPRLLHLATHGFFLEDLPAPDPDAFGPGASRGLTVDFISGSNNSDVVFDRPSGPALGNPLERSGLALVDANLASASPADTPIDGLLSAQEVLGLELDGTELVVLSACDTGVGDIQAGEGVYGLRRAFQQAGAQAVMSTLWSISDLGTQRFMQRFYERFLGGTPPQQALRQTQLEFIEDPQQSHPFFWAPFTLVGAQ